MTDVLKNVTREQLLEDVETLLGDDIDTHPALDSAERQRVARALDHAVAVLRGLVKLYDDGKAKGVNFWESLPEGAIASFPQTFGDPNEMPTPWAALPSAGE